MFRRLRAWAVRGPRVVVSLVWIALALPAMMGPLAYCLTGADAPQVVAAVGHCETLAAAPDGRHLPAMDEALGFAAGAASATPSVPTGGFFLHVGGLPPLFPERSLYGRHCGGGAAPDPGSMCLLAGAIAGHSARLLI